MTKLSQIREALQGNPNIEIVRAPEANHLNELEAAWAHTVDFYVAPKKGGVYTAVELQELMLSLVPGLEPTQQHDFSETEDELRFGKLYFDERIGTRSVHVEIQLLETEMFPPPVHTNLALQSEPRETPLMRRVWVRLFPNTLIADDALKGKHESAISKRELAKYRRMADHFVLDTNS